MNKKYQIFISSTYKDLIDERNKVRDVILSMYHFPIGMEMFNASDEEQWDIIKETIDSSDYYILIIGKRYGSVIDFGPDTGISYTEKEFKYAKSVGIPILAFIKDDTAVTSNNMDLEADKIQKLNKFIEAVKDKREVEWFENVDELGTKVSLALHKQINRKKRPGWIRSDSLDVEKTLEEIVVQNQRIRFLEKENKALREQVESRLPYLGIDMTLQGTTEQAMTENTAGDTDTTEETDAVTAEHLIMRRKADIPKNYLGNTKPLSMDMVPVEFKDKVEQADLDDYNRKLPDAEIIRKYNDGMHYYNEVRMNGQRLDLVLYNDGTIKATDIHVTLEFPKEFYILERRKAENLTMPTAPEMPRNPILRVVQKRNNLARNQYQTFFVDVAPKVAAANAYFNGFLQERTLIAESLAKGWHIEIDGQTVQIWKDSLLHTRQITINDICIVPVKAGRFTIKATFICEEYAHQEEKDIEIEVIDSKM